MKRIALLLALSLSLLLAGVAHAAKPAPSFTVAQTFVTANDVGELTDIAVTYTYDNLSATSTYSIELACTGGYARTTVASSTPLNGGIAVYESQVPYGAGGVCTLSFVYKGAALASVEVSAR